MSPHMIADLQSMLTVLQHACEPDVQLTEMHFHARVSVSGAFAGKALGTLNATYIGSRPHKPGDHELDGFNLKLAFVRYDFGKTMVQFHVLSAA